MTNFVIKFCHWLWRHAVQWEQQTLFAAGCRLRSYAGVIVCVALVISCSAADDSTKSAEMDVVDLSIINLISNPKRYEDMKVIVIGVLDVRPENIGLYLSLSDYDKKIYTNAVGISFDDDKMYDAALSRVGTYVSIKSKWCYDKAMDRGFICHIEWLQAYPYVLYNKTAE